MRSEQVIALVITMVVAGVVLFLTIGPSIDWNSKKKVEDSGQGRYTGRSNSKTTKASNSNSSGQIIDRLNDIPVYFNGRVGNVSGRHLTRDGYNLGLKYQCVEFVKRYYYDYYGHKMPNTYGHAKEFFNRRLRDGDYNQDRGLFQYDNGGKHKPLVSDIIIFGSSKFNSFGHIAIVSKLRSDHVEIIQQNGGPNNPTRLNFKLYSWNGTYHIEDENILGWLRKGR